MKLQWKLKLCGFTGTQLGTAASGRKVKFQMCTAYAAPTTPVQVSGANRPSGRCEPVLGPS
eukprot:NODE_24896_length_606_cov_8.747390.p6 GENE.NODE_24896_length_606_cov_8.747390~~NODE_24896_length_606_cov_8.747390.p6  ORF type:complete len:61 (+),score=5.47 NODE_24896_length_606_cov_8.747390:256-438(+)